MTEKEIMRGIHYAAMKRLRANAERKRATEQLREYCLAAREAGIPITRIAQEGNLSRQGVYDLLSVQPSQ